MTPAHPGPASVSIPAELVQAMVDHARSGYPNEACGVVVGSAPAAGGGRPLRWVACTNAARSPYRYEIDAQELLRLTVETEDADEVFWAIVHSHVASPARPSPTDIGLAWYPDALYVLVSLDQDPAEIRAWRIVGGEVYEVELLVGS